MASGTPARYSVRRYAVRRYSVRRYAVRHRPSTSKCAPIRYRVEMPEPEPGTYRHYKGNLYEVLGTATHSETEDTLVVYRALYGGHGLWVRPLAMFQENVELDGRSVRRFAPIDDGSGESAVSSPLDGTGISSGTTGHDVSGAVTAVDAGRARTNARNHAESVIRANSGPASTVKST